MWPHKRLGLQKKDPDVPLKRGQTLMGTLGVDTMRWDKSASGWRQHQPQGHGGLPKMVALSPDQRMSQRQSGEGKGMFWLRGEAGRTDRV